MLIAELPARGVDVIFGLHGSRKTDFRKGKRLGTRDPVIVRHKPRTRSDWMEKGPYEQFPQTLSIRETRAAGNVLVTTILSPDEAPKSERSKLYQPRWHVELDVRNIKTTLGMETLSCTTPKMNEKE